MSRFKDKIVTPRDATETRDGNVVPTMKTSEKYKIK